MGSSTRPRPLRQTRRHSWCSSIGYSGTVAGLGAVCLQWVLEAAGLDLNVVSFSYPSRPWERAAIPQAADDLKTWLDTELQAYRHLVFVTHRRPAALSWGDLAGGRPPFGAYLGST